MKSKDKQIRKTRRKWILPVAAVVIAAAVGYGILNYMGHDSSDPVYVYPFQYIGMTEYWGDSRESNGPVTTDKVQTVFLSDTQTVTEILVQEGDEVKKGDLMMTFDTTLSDLQLEKKRLDVEKKKLQLETAQKELRRINSMKPMATTQHVENPETGGGSGDVLTSDVIYPVPGTINSRTYEGKTAATAVIYWIRSDTKIDDALFRQADLRVAEIRNQNAVQPTDPTDATEPTEPTGSLEPSVPTEPSLPTEPPATTAPNPTEEGSGESSGTSVSDVEYLPDGSEFYMVIKITSGNTELGERKVWQCLKVSKNSGSYAFQFADTLIQDYSTDNSSGAGTSVNTPQTDLGSGYTAAQIAQMRSDKQKKIKDLEFQIKMAESEYKIMQTEAVDGNVYAKIDGKVISCLTEEEAKKTRQPVLKISGGGGFYVEGFVSELEKDAIKIGQEVTINDWNTGMTYTGNIVSVGDFPKQNGYYGNGNPNASFYPFKVFVDEQADLQSGSYVSVVYSAAESENGIYLENPFLRTENGNSYVLVMGEDGKLEQRFVTTGKSLWGSYTQILSGLTTEDLIAFPYGKTVKPGVPVVEGDMADLYSG